MLSIYLAYTPYYLYKVGCAIVTIWYMPSICLAYALLISRLTTAVYSHRYMYILSICIAYSVHKVAEAKLWLPMRVLYG